MRLPSQHAEVEALVGDSCGFVEQIFHVTTPRDEPRLTTHIARFGDVKLLWPHLPAAHDGQISGAGVALGEREGMLPAVCEAVERYCASVYSTEQFLIATASELGRDCLDLGSVPVCSRKELTHPQCPLVAPDKNAPMRWVRAISLGDGRRVLLPAVMVYLYAGFLNQAERIWFPITTGCAAQKSLEHALLNAILEVIERDAISLTWLQNLPLPRIEIDELPGELQAYWERYQRSSKELEYHFFDATLDLGLPTVYGVQVSHVDSEARTLVCGSTALDPSTAVLKALRDMTAARSGFRKHRKVSDSWDNFNDIYQGALYMARGENAHAFDFLLNSPRRIRLSTMQSLSHGNVREDLGFVLQLLRANNMDAYAVDLSTDEALRAGIHVVRAVIPALQPVGFQYRARYLGHPRLYRGPSKAGYHSLPEEKLNPWPQPFC